MYRISVFIQCLDVDWYLFARSVSFVVFLYHSLSFDGTKPRLSSFVDIHVGTIMCVCIVECVSTWSSFNILGGERIKRYFPGFIIIVIVVNITSITHVCFLYFVICSRSKNLGSLVNTAPVVARHVSQCSPKNLPVWLPV